MCRGWDLWVQVDQRGCCDSWSSQRRNSRDAEHVVVEAQIRVGGRPGADGEVDTRVLVRTDKWYGSGKAWPIRSFVTRAYAVAIDRDLYVVVIMMCTGRALDCAVSAMYSWSMEAWRTVCHAHFLWNDARLVFPMLEVLAILLDPKDTGGQSGCWVHRNDKHRFECIGRGCLHKRIQRCFRGSGEKQDYEFVCWYCEEQQ